MIGQAIHPLKNLDERQTLFHLVTIAFLLRLYAVLMAQGIANDSAAYGFMARDFMKGNIEKALSIPGHPFYPLLMAFFSMDAANVEIAGRLISLFFGILTIFPLYFLVKESIGAKAALYSTLFYAFHPYLVTYSGMMLTEATYWGLLALSVYFFWTGLKNDKIWKMVFSGVFLGLSYLTRPEGIGYIIVFLGWIGIDGFLKKRWLKPLLFAGVLTTSLLAISLPYILYVQRETGQWLISMKAMDAQSQIFRKDNEQTYPEKGAERLDHQKKKSRILWIMGNVIQYFPSVFYHYLRAYHFSLWPILLFGLIRKREEDLAYELFLASLVFFHLLSLATFLPSTIRFSVPVIPLSLFWAGAGILEMRRYIEKLMIDSSTKIVFGSIALIILVQLPQGLKPERGHRAIQKQVGLWLKGNTPRDAIIMSNSPQEVFYAEREFLMIPTDRHQGYPMRSFEEVMDYAKMKGVRYLIVDKNTHEVNPGLMVFLNSQERISKEKLKVIFKHEERSTTIYELVY